MGLFFSIICANYDEDFRNDIKHIASPKNFPDNLDLLINVLLVKNRVWKTEEFSLISPMQILMSEFKSQCPSQ